MLGAVPQDAPGSTIHQTTLPDPHASPECVASLLVSLPAWPILDFLFPARLNGGWYPIMMTLLYFYPSALRANVIMIELHEELLNIITIILTTTSGPSLGHV